ncbi:MAG: transporter substrate-binding domain-containing protein [Chloroflexi bacterium]|nr:transporter substrate-binding domain-containing protein [Chloroflexota bacterium]
MKAHLIAVAAQVVRCLGRGKKRFVLGAIVVCLSAVCAVMAANAIQSRQLADKQWGDLHARGALRVGIDPGWQPFSFYGVTDWEGLDADLTREIARRLDLQVQTNPVGYDSMYDALTLWQVDIVVSAVVVDPARMDDAAYTQSYFDAGLRLVTKSSSGIRSVADLDHRRLTATLGSDADRTARHWERRATNMVRVSASDDMAAVLAVQSGQADAAIVDALSAMKLVRSADGLISISIAPQPYSIAVRRDNPWLLEALNRVLTEMRSDGTLDTIVGRWVQR